MEQKNKRSRIKKAISEFRIIGGRVVYSNDEFEHDFKTMKDDNEGEYGEAHYEIINSVQHFQHKYLYGYLLPDITHAMGETDSEYVKQFILKPKFLLWQIPDGDFRKIPSKHMSGCRICTNINPDGEEVVIGYIPSTSKLNFDEMAKFIQDCENFLLLDCNGSVGMSAGSKQDSVQVEALRARELAKIA